MRNLRAWWGALLVAAAVTASRAEEPTARGAEVPAEVRALLERVERGCPGPGSLGFRELRCTLTIEPMTDVPIRTTLVWTDTGGVHASVTSEVASSEALEKLRGLLNFRTTMAMGFREFWNSRRLDGISASLSGEPSAPRVALRARDKPLAVELSLTETARPAELRMRLETSDAPVECLWSDLRFEEQGERWSPAGFVWRSAGAVHRIAIESHAPMRGGFSLPRRITIARQGGEVVETWLLHDVFVDGLRVDGTSLPEARAGRVARKDEATRRALDLHAAAVGGEIPRETACRVTVRTRSGTFRFRCRWWDDRTCQASPEPGTVDTQEQADFRAGFAKTAGASIAPDLPDFAAFDGAAEADGAVLLTPLDPASPLRRIRLRFDARHRAFVSEQTFIDGSTAKVRLLYDERDGRTWVCETVQESGATVRRHRSERWHIDGFPLLVRRVVAESGDDAGEVLETSDWTVDGRPVPGTDVDPDAPAPAPREAPR